MNAFLFNRRPTPPLNGEHAADDSPVHAVLHRLQHTVRRLGDKVREGGKDILEDRQQLVAEKLQACEASARDLADSLKLGEQGSFAKPIEKLADGVAGMSDAVRDHSPEEWADDLADSIARHPAVSLGAAFAAGLLAGRFIKASDPS